MSWVGRIFAGSPAQAANAAAVPHAPANVMIHPEQDPTNREQTVAAKKDKTPAMQSPAADPAAQQHAFQVRLLKSSGPPLKGHKLGPHHVICDCVLALTLCRSAASCDP